MSNRPNHRKKKLPPASSRFLKRRDAGEIVTTDKDGFVIGIEPCEIEEQPKKERG